MAVRTLVKADGRVVCSKCRIAIDPWSRMRGLLGRRGLADGEGIFLRPASSVHTFFMAFPIDVVFLDRTLKVVRVVPRLRPWRTAWRRGASSVLEMAAGQSAECGLTVGDHLDWASR